MKQIKIWSIILLAVMMMPLVASCGSDDDSSDSNIIPSGTYIEENGKESELFTMVINGYNIKVTITRYGEVWKSFQGTYTISGNTIKIKTSDGNIEEGYFKMSGNRVTIGEITYIRQ